MGKLDAVYGTLDHLILLLGRVTDFSAKDVARKKAIVERNGGFWIPAPGMFGSGPPPGPPPGMRGPPPEKGGPPPGIAMGGPSPGTPSGTSGPRPGMPTQSRPPPPPPPQMYGMVPPQPTLLPSAFVSPTQSTREASDAQSSPIDLDDLTAQTSAALIEWDSISTAFATFAAALSPQYSPLTPDLTPQIPTPFGPALQYRTHGIACIQSLYHTGLIVLRRAHPSMPPAAMMAAGVAASQTASHANTIGRICAGIYPTHAAHQLNPSHGAALIESTIALFFAGVQFVEPAQRGWTIAKLRDVARLTGWPTAAAIASGCETAWTKAGEMGRAPKYEKTMDRHAKDPRVSGNRPANAGNGGTGSGGVGGGVGGAAVGQWAGMPGDVSDRKFVVKDKAARVQWAMGLLTLEEDL